MMRTTLNRFDCLEMKERVQRELRLEYEARRAEFSSYADFINATADESGQIREFRRGIRRFKTVAG